MLEQWKAIWTNLSVRHRVTIAATVLVAAAAVFGITKWQHERDFKPLYTGMSAEDAGAVVSKLKESGVEFRVSDDGLSSVFATSRTQIRACERGPAEDRSNRVRIVRQSQSRHDRFC